MSNIIKIKGKLTSGAPALAQLQDRELCVVIPDGNLYIRVDNQIRLIGGPAKADLSSPTFTGTPSSTTPATNDDSTRIATTAFVKAVVAALQSAGDMSKSQYDPDNDGKVTAAVNADQLGGVIAANYATQAFVNQAIANLVASSPAALDTLNELAAALNNDANFATTVNNALATKLDGDSTIDGGTF